MPETTQERGPFAFRLVFERPPLAGRLQTDQEVIPLPHARSDIRLELRSGQVGNGLGSAHVWVVFGDGFSSEEDALTFGTQVRGALDVAMALHEFAGDFGDVNRFDPKLQDAQWKTVKQGANGQFVDLQYGLNVYPTEPTQDFRALISPTILHNGLAPTVDRFCTSFEAALDAYPPTDQHEHAARVMYSRMALT